MLHRGAIIRLAAGLLLLLTTLAASHPPTTVRAAASLVDLGSFASTNKAVAGCSSPYAGFVAAINEAGVVTGKTAWGKRANTAFRAVDGAITRLKSGKGGGAGLDINASGQIVGVIYDDLGDDPCDPRVLSGEIGTSHAVTWIGTKLQRLPDREEFSSATDINDAGLIAGSVGHKPVVWREGHLQELTLPKGFDRGSVTDINASGQIVGWVYGDDYQVVGSALWEGDKVTLLPEKFRGVVINDAGVIAGTLTGDYGAARLVDGTLETLAQLPKELTAVSVADINEAGDVLINVISASQPVALLWHGEKAAEIASLLPPDAAFTEIRAKALTDTGVILLAATGADGKPHGLILTMAVP